MPHIKILVIAHVNIVMFLQEYCIRLCNAAVASTIFVTLFAAQFLYNLLMFCIKSQPLLVIIAKLQSKVT